MKILRRRFVFSTCVHRDLKKKEAMDLIFFINTFYFAQFIHLIIINSMMELIVLEVDIQPFLKVMTFHLGQVS